MTRRMWGFGLVVGGVLGSLAGCTGQPLTHRSQMRQQAQMEAPPDRSAGAGEATEAGDTSELTREARGFFKPGRSGALSREGAEVEADLGISR